MDSFHLQQTALIDRFLISLLHNLTLRCFLMFSQIMQLPIETESTVHILSVGDKMWADYLTNAIKEL